MGITAVSCPAAMPPGSAAIQESRTCKPVQKRRFNLTGPAPNPPVLPSLHEQQFVSAPNFHVKLLAEGCFRPPGAIRWIESR
jgi:hypothetical protein